MRKSPKKINPGFTLIELLITVAIIAILAVVGVAVYQNTQSSARDARRRADIDAIIQAADTAKANANTGIYPTIDGTLFSSGVFPTDPSAAKVYCESHAATLPAEPTDPSAWTETCPSSYTALSIITGATKFKVCATLDNDVTVVCKTGTVN